MLVGDVIQKIRTAITDQPGKLPSPTASFSVVTPSASSLRAGTYYLVVTQRNQWGETLPTAESSVQTVSAGQAIQINSSLLPGAIALRAYLTLFNGAAGSECQFVEGTTSPLTIAADPTQAGNVPTRNSAYNPDSDGDSFSCATLYDWVNDALRLASQICGGLIDYGGVSTIVGNPSYVVPGQWKSISDIWYDGYPLAPDKVGNFFRRNSITASVLSQVATSIFTDKMALEVWPQPSRTAGATTLQSTIGAAATSLTAVSLSGFLLTNGMVQVEDEIMSYAPMTGNTLNNLLRGLGGTTAAAHAAGAAVKELNLFFHGWRMYAPTFQPGNAQLTIPIPVGWEVYLQLFGLARAKLAEQNIQEYQALHAAAEKGFGDWYRTNRVTTGPRQIGDSSSQLEVIPALGGGWVVP